MLDVALTFLTKSFNTYLRTRTGSDFGAALLTRIVDDSGKWAAEGDHIGVSLLHIEEERILKGQLPETKIVNGKHLVVAPALRLGLHVLFAAGFQHYDQALKLLSHVLAFFQAHPVFSHSQYPDLDDRIERLAVELLSLTYEQINQMWRSSGANSYPPPSTGSAWCSFKTRTWM